MTDKQYSAHEWLNKAYWLEKTELKSKVEYAEKCKPDDGAIDYSKERVQNGSFGAQEDRLNTYAMACDVVDKTRVRIEKIRQSKQEVIEKISSRIVWLISSIFAPFSASTLETPATIPERSLPKTETTQRIAHPFDQDG